ncbi:hypothetical protein FA10DRAFT_276844 [Acaromyces ingoldii]|uniref:Uncharacterized protein n=1 Tax=Acaromyces ingoldii TaxID=215250 RepID=A0A316YUA6_9BASI|nr:hypothetical protein FA10DRAFT_276844 [Acaromyces ingoldii]PWN92849.1 hypothetical protein FA10DRAFT_276844 [Acaromyces ingoldii]
MLSAAECASYLKPSLARSFRRNSSETVSKRKADILAYQISSLVLGYRTACLVDCFGGDKDEFSCLRSVLHGFANGYDSIFPGSIPDEVLVDGLKSLFFVCHAPTGQIFIVDRRRFLRRMDRAMEETEYFVKSERPAYLSALLEAIRDNCKPKALTTAPGSRPTQDVLLDSGPPSGSVANGEIDVDELSRHATEGIALAGWLLDYEVIYYYEQSQPNQHQTYSCSVDDGFALDLGSFWPEALVNNLEGVPLLLVQVDLVGLDGLKRRNLYAFTIPQQCVLEIFGSEKEVIENVKLSVERRLQGRDRFDIVASVTTQDRVAL